MQNGRGKLHAVGGGRDERYHRDISHLGREIPKLPGWPQNRGISSARPGDLHYSKEGKTMLYRDILIEDQRRWSPVKQFRLLVEKIERRGADTYFAESL